MAFIQKDKLFSWKWIKNYSLIIIGAFIMASGFVLFITPYKIVPGGVYGISIVLHYILGTPVGAMALAFDVPLTIIGIKVLGPRFGMKTVVGFLSTALFVDTLTWVYGTQPLVEGDALLSSIFGGLFIGVGISGISFFIFFTKKITKYKKAYNDFPSDDSDLTLRFRKIEKELEEYRNEFHDKYVDDGYDAY